MNCKNILVDIERAVDGELSPEELERVALHVEACQVCKQVREELIAETCAVSEAFGLGGWLPPHLPRLEAQVLDGVRRVTPPIGTVRLDEVVLGMIAVAFGSVVLWLCGVDTGTHGDLGGSVAGPATAVVATSFVLGSTVTASWARFMDQAQRSLAGD